MSDYGPSPWSQQPAPEPAPVPEFHVPDQRPVEQPAHRPTDAPTYQPAEPPVYPPVEPPVYPPVEPQPNPYQPGSVYQPGQSYPAGAGYPTGMPYPQSYQQPYQPGQPQPVPGAWPAWQQSPWPAPVPEKHRFGIGSLIAVAVVTAVVCGAVGAVTGFALKDAKAATATGGTPSPSASGIDIPSTVPSSLPSSAPSTPTDTSAGAALLAKIVPAPAGAVPFDLPNGDNGIMDLAANCKEFFSKTPLEAGRLAQEGFVVAAATEYARADGTTILTHLTEFKTIEGATSYISGRFASWQVDKAVTGTFAVPGGGKGFEKHALDAIGNRRTIMYEQVGTIVIAVDVFTPGSFNRPFDLTVMAAQVKAVS